MALRDGCYATVWSARQNGKIYSCNISVSTKDKRTNEYKNDFSGYVNFGGQAAVKVASLGLPEFPNKDNPAKRRVQIKGSPDISTYYNKEAADKLLAQAGNNEDLKKFIRARANEKYITIWDFEIPENNPPTNAKPAQETQQNDESEELPF